MKIVYPKTLEKDVRKNFSKSMIDRFILFSDNLLITEKKQEHPFSKFK